MIDSKRLLLVDDDEDNRILVEFALEYKTNWETSTASNGMEGIIKAETENPDVILLDLVMPDSDGLSVCKIIKSNLFTCTIPIIFITAMVQTQVISQLENTLAVGIITKPFDVVNLDCQIAKMCGWEDDK